MVGRRIAFDYGLARIGVAVCDPDGIIATPLAAIKTQGCEKQITALMAEYQPIAIYVGLPLHLSGQASQSSQASAAFVESLAKYGVPVRMIDERFTTKTAAAKLAEAGFSSKAAKRFIDSASAVAILEQGLATEAR